MATTWPSKARCTCPSRKHPCKHGLALLLLWAEGDGSVAEEARPADFAAEWVRRLAAKAPGSSGSSAREAAPPDPEAQARRLAQRIETMSAGIDEFEQWLLDLVRQGLASARHQPYSFWDAAAARLLVAQSPPQIAVLDVNMPGENGLALARWLRETQPGIGIIMLTTVSEAIDRVVGLELGADDYVVKPFSPKELVARVRAVLRRTQAAQAGGPEVLRVADVEVDLPRMRVAVAGRPVELTPTEFQLLGALMREPGRVFTRGQLLDAVHGVAFESYERAIDAHVKNLRKKIEPTPGRPRYLLTVHGVGYRFADA